MEKLYLMTMFCRLNHQSSLSNFIFHNNMNLRLYLHKDAIPLKLLEFQIGVENLRTLVTECISK